MRQLKLSKAFALMKSGPVVLVTTHDGKQANIMPICWTMVIDFNPVFAITTGKMSHRSGETHDQGLLACTRGCC